MKLNKQHYIQEFSKEVPVAVYDPAICELAFNTFSLAEACKVYSLSYQLARTIHTRASAASSSYQVGNVYTIFPSEALMISCICFVRNTFQTLIDNESVDTRDFTDVYINSYLEIKQYIDFMNHVH